jgi:transposase
MGASNSTASDVLARLKAAGLGWPLPEAIGDGELEARLYREHGRTAPDPRQPEWTQVQAEFTRKHVHLALLCGRSTVRRASVFVAVLGACSYTYAETCADQRTESFFAVHVHAFAFLGSAAELIVPDNLKTGVTRPDRYEPDSNPAYAELAAHYGTAVLPARPRRPRDKAKVETGVPISYREILAPLRKRTFYSLAELNGAIAVQFKAVNARPFAKLPESRASVLAEREVPLPRALPAAPFTYRTRRTTTVHIDYHVDLEGHYYSVSYHLAREQVELRFDARTVEVFHDGRRVARYLRSGRRERATTDAAHMSAKHRAMAAWTAARIAPWASHTRPATAALAAEIMASRPHPEHKDPCR